MIEEKVYISGENEKPGMIDLDENALAIAIKEYLSIKGNTIETLALETGLTTRYLGDVKLMKANPTLDAMKRITSATKTKMKLVKDWPTEI